MNRLLLKIRETVMSNLAHCGILLAGSVLLLAFCFQNSLWFDESYTVGLMHHDMIGLIKWSAGDVHPPLYYMMLKVFTTFFGKSFYAMRIFSAIGGILLAALGFTHIRRDFGKKIGFWYSFCVFFCGCTFVYSAQIRMYTWAALFVSLTAIYAYRIFAAPDCRRNRIIFVICSVCAAYIQHFALFSVAAINIVLLIALRKRGDAKAFKNWFIDGVIQIAAYIPGALLFLHQISVGGADWIKIEWPDIIFDLVSYHLLGDVLWEQFYPRNSLGYMIAGAIFLVMYVAGGVLLYRYMKSCEDKKVRGVLKGALYSYFGVICFSLVVSLFRPIYYARYTIVICGLLFFVIGALIASFRKKIFKVLAAVVLIAILCVEIVYFHGILYHPSSNLIRETMDERVEAEDTFLFDGASTYVVTVHYPDNTAYFFNNWHWNVQDAYRAFGQNSYVLETLECEEVENLGDRVWTEGRGLCYQKLMELGYEEIEAHGMFLRYHNNNFEMILMQKK